MERLTCHPGVTPGASPVAAVSDYATSCQAMPRQATPRHATNFTNTLLPRTCGAGREGKAHQSTTPAHCTGTGITPNLTAKPTKPALSCRLNPPEPGTRAGPLARSCPSAHPAPSAPGGVQGRRG